MNRVYHEKTILEVNLYTKGRPVNVEEHAVGNYINTATSDLMDFAYFIESDEITDMIADWGMDISPESPRKRSDRSSNDSRYRYRAMTQFTVYLPKRPEDRLDSGMDPNIQTAAEAELMNRSMQKTM